MTSAGGVVMLLWVALGCCGVLVVTGVADITCGIVHDVVIACVADCDVVSVGGGVEYDCVVCDVGMTVWGGVVFGVGAVSVWCC